MQTKTNIDDLLTQVDMTPDSLQERKPTESAIINNEPNEELTNNAEDSSSESNEANETSNHESDSQETTTDDYGQTASKKERMYSQAEVQEMMRDRNKRGEFAKQDNEYLPNETKPSESSDEDGEGWEEQFEHLVEKTLTKREQKIQEQQWQARAQQEQAEFEVKFNSGAARYADFESVVVGKAFTPDMVFATKAMKDPAAFIYAAAKTQAAELERISKINDRLVQAVEIGKLEERMRKGKASSTNAPKPIERVNGDVTQDRVKPRNVDDILREEDAKRLKGRR